MHSKKVEQCLNFCCEVSRQLIRNGAEIYRVEESANRMLAAYGYKEAEVFAVPSCVIMSIHYGERNYTKSVRIKSATNNLDKLDRLNALCRDVCRETPEIDAAFSELKAIVGRPAYPVWLSYFGYGCVAAFFTLFWGGNALDAAIAFFCGMIVKAVVGHMVRLNANVFFVNVCASMLLVMVPVVLTYMGCTAIHTDQIIIGSIMLLVPGIAITNVMRDVIIGDFVTALSKLAEVLIVALAIAVGIAIPFGLARALLGGDLKMEQYLPCLYAFLACAGFSIVFEIKKPVLILLSCVTGAVGWLVYLLFGNMESEVVRYFLATIVVALLSEVFARIMKAPATIFLIIGIVPLVPGGGLYYAMDALINADYVLFGQKGIETAACAGAIAAGVSVVTSIVRMVASHGLDKIRKEQQRE